MGDELLKDKTSNLHQVNGIENLFTYIALGVIGTLP